MDLLQIAHVVLGALGSKRKFIRSVTVIFVVFKNVILAPVVVGDGSVVKNWC